MRIKGNWAEYLLVAVLVVIDQVVKLIIARNVDLHEQIPVIKNFFSITHVRNAGGAFSFLAEKSWGIYFLASMSVVISVVLLIAIYRLKGREWRWIRLTTAFLAGGSVGNMIDRIFRHSVLDFLMFDLGKYTFPIFNVADMCIVCGSFALAILLFFDKRFMKPEDEEKKSRENEPDETSGSPGGSVNTSYGEG